MRNSPQHQQPRASGLPVIGRVCRGFFQRLEVLCLLLPGLFLAGTAFGESLTLPLQFEMLQTRFNLNSLRGVPLTTSTNDYGSDGRLSPFNESQQFNTDVTSNQFSSLVSFGGGLGLTFSRWTAMTNSTVLDGSNAFSTIVATNMRVPIGKDIGGNIRVIQRGARIGAPFLSREVNLLFGQVIEVPVKDQSGTLLTNVVNTDYWEARPYSNVNEQLGYYWSPHAGKVYAHQSGPISITWVKKGAYTASTFPSNYVNSLGSANSYTNGASVFLLHTVNYLVSASPVKPPRQMYWTAGAFDNTGKPVGVPVGVTANIRYNAAFPERVDEEYVEIGSSFVVTTGLLQKTRTLWYDQDTKSIHAYNLEGRVFLELLGDANDDGTFGQLGIEVVDVSKRPSPLDVEVELGDRITPPPPGTLDTLTPSPVIQLAVGGSSFAFSKNVAGSSLVELYAIRETINNNDYLVHWMEDGVAGLKWPRLFGRYRLMWPANVARYSHYIRPPEAVTEEGAQKTAVQLYTENVPVIAYQDPFDQPRAKLTPDFKFYTFLNDTYPAHRTLLQLTSGDSIAFVRVFSWLNAGPALDFEEDTLSTNTIYGSSVATNLAAWQTNNSTFSWGNVATAPRVITKQADVGRRINPPTDEKQTLPSGVYLAGHLDTEVGTSYDAASYIDPFTSGFDEAALGAIIPVNAMPGSNKLEVLWFRSETPVSASANENIAANFLTIYWPSVIGRYTLNWPTNATQIVLASNDGSGALPSLQASGSIYFQNDFAQAGYNPNEEHALMQGGQVYALRDDLNVTNGLDYTSDPFVLLRYMDADGRPNMKPFQVVRETDTIRFNYLVTAGTILQPPMPLPLLEKPVPPAILGTTPKSLNQEMYFRTVDTSTSNGVLTTVEPHQFRPWFRELALQPDDFSQTYWYIVTGANYDTQELTGYVSAQRNLGIEPSSISSTTNSTLIEFNTAGFPSVSTSQVLVLIAPASALAVELTYVTAVNSNTVRYSTASAEDAEVLEAESGNLLLFVAEQSLTDGQFSGWKLRTEAVPVAGIPDDAAFTLKDRKNNLWVYRGPHHEGDSPYMQMQFYYKTLAGFFFPELGRDPASQPSAGVITPYLRSQNPDGTYAGDGISGTNNALAVAYQAIWPAATPVLQMAETLTVPKRGLPAVRGQSSLQIIYQQSEAVDPTNRPTSVVLHDPTREKTFAFGPAGATDVLSLIPASVRSSVYRGKTYFPNLPPHLVERFFFDPNSGSRGKLIFRGEFVDDPVGDKYVLLNVLSDKDSSTLKDLCIVDDPDKQRWDAAIDALATTLEHFVEAPQSPGTFIPGPTTEVGPDGLSEITDEDVAVDSYALTAMGPGIGYVTLIAGNGEAFTPDADPVSLHVIRVARALYQGQVKVILADNPLAEKVTLQQVVDLAARTGDYDFEWRIASPVDGAPPSVYQTVANQLVGNGAWTHIPFPLASDAPGSIASTPAARKTSIGNDPTTIQAVSRITYVGHSASGGNLVFSNVVSASSLVPGNAVLFEGTTAGGASTPTNVPGIVVSTGVNSVTIFPATSPTNFNVSGLVEAVVQGIPQSVVYRDYQLAPGVDYSQLWLSMNLDAFLGAKVYINGELQVVANTGDGDTDQNTAPADANALTKAYRIDPAILDRNGGDTFVHVVVELFSTAPPDVVQSFALRLAGYSATDLASAPGSQWLPLDPVRYPDGVRAILGESADVRALADNYLIMRYRATNENHASFSEGWSRWTTPALAEGWIKRVLAGINPFNQRLTDLFNNRVNTDVSILTQAGHRYEGDVALNLEVINSYGLIEIYETVLRRGRMLSIDAGINYGPANDALLLVAGYLNDLYMMVGNEAWADAANPTIGFGTADQTYGDIATAMFSFKGQMASLLEEELALLRGRDDFLQPGVEVAPFYNRLVWNYTRGIDAGEVIYALNYNIQENPDLTPDGIINAADAAHMYPMAHGDAYGHYLTALKGYYSLMLSAKFDWVPRIEAVNVLGVPVAVDYQDERKFAAAAAAVARTGRQIFDLTWRKDYHSVQSDGWEDFGSTRINNTTRQLPSTRYWGMDHWATRIGQGNYINWVVGNSMLPDIDPNPNHEGIQKVDRSTVPELQELPVLAKGLQTALDNAEGGLSPLGIPEGGMAFDIDPVQYSGANGSGDKVTHFEQIYERAKVALNNAVAAFDDAKNVTALMRSEQDSLTELQNDVANQELAYEHALIEIYGTPYSDDIGPGKTWKQGYTGPDLIHFSYVETPELSFPTMWNYPGSTGTNDDTFAIDITDLPADWYNNTSYTNLDIHYWYDPEDYQEGTHFISFNLGPHGFANKPRTWVGRRSSPGSIQQAISESIAAHDRLRQALYDQSATKGSFDRAFLLFLADQRTYDDTRKLEKDLLIAEQTMESVKFASDLIDKILESTKETIESYGVIAGKALPESLIAGVAAGGDLTSGGRAILESFGVTLGTAIEWQQILQFGIVNGLEFATATAKRWVEFDKIAPLARTAEQRQALAELTLMWEEMQAKLWTINEGLRAYDDAQRNVLAVIAQGDRIQQEREVFRKHVAVQVQGARTRDAAFRIFRNEKLERYKTLFDLSARYALLAANAYDYETGLLNTPAGRSFKARMINSRALGVVVDGEPQFAGSNSGDPGLSSALAEMKADWDVVRSRLGFNNPDNYGTTASLRSELFRIIPHAEDEDGESTTEEADEKWVDVLQNNRKANILEDPDVARHCMQIGVGSGQAVPGIVLEFGTTISEGYNLFGQPLMPGDHAYSVSSFSTKILGQGVALMGYIGMNDPSATGVEIGDEPDVSFLDPDALAATPYIYLIPCGADSMRSPPLGDTSDIRSWTVDDLAIPMPFNIGQSDLNTLQLYTSADSLTEELFAVRKHQAFRPVSNPNVFHINGNTDSAELHQYTNRRLIGRSIWNSKWKLVIPGKTLLADPEEGLERFIRTVYDIRLHFVTYSYSGN